MTREKSWRCRNPSQLIVGRGTKCTHITAPTKSIPDTIGRSYISRISIDSFLSFLGCFSRRVLSETRATARENHRQEEPLVISGRETRGGFDLREKFDAVRRQTPRHRSVHEFRTDGGGREGSSSNFWISGTTIRVYDKWRSFLQSSRSIFIVSATQMPLTRLLSHRTTQYVCTKIQSHMWLRVTFTRVLSPTVTEQMID